MIDNTLIVFTDGGSRGNPGEAAIGVYITDNKKNEIVRFGKKIGFTTNNVAEYRAVVEALSWINVNKDRLTGYSKINFFLDSNLVCSQIRGFFKVKDSKLRDLLFLVRQRVQEIKIPIFYNHIPREKNKKADQLVNRALDDSFYAT